MQYCFITVWIWIGKYMADHSAGRGKAITIDNDKDLAYINHLKNIEFSDDESEGDEDYLVIEEISQKDKMSNHIESYPVDEHDDADQSECDNESTAGPSDLTDGNTLTALSPETLALLCDLENLHEQAAELAIPQLITDSVESSTKNENQKTLKYPDYADPTRRIPGEKLPQHINNAKNSPALGNTFHTQCIDMECYEVEPDETHPEITDKQSSNNKTDDSITSSIEAVLNNEELPKKKKKKHRNSIDDTLQNKDNPVSNKKASKVNTEDKRISSNKKNTSLLRQTTLIAKSDKATASSSSQLKGDSSNKKADKQVANRRSHRTSDSDESSSSGTDDDITFCGGRKRHAKGGGRIIADKKACKKIHGILKLTAEGRYVITENHHAILTKKNWKVEILGGCISDKSKIDLDLNLSGRVHCSPSIPKLPCFE